MADDQTADGPGAEGGSVLRAVHTALPVVASGRFDATWPPWRLVTFLNRALKDRGLVFGLSLLGDEAVVTVYDAGSGAPGDSPSPDGRGPKV